MNEYFDRLQSLRALMDSRGWDALIVTGTDPHNSEYSAPRWHQVEWLSGCSCEGDIVVTADHAGLWTDTRYFIQAQKELPGSGVELHKTRVPDQVLIPEWLSKTFSAEESVTIAVDGLCQTLGSVNEIREAIGDGCTIVDVPDLLSPLWTDRPNVPQTPIITLGKEQVGMSRNEKLEWLRSWLRSKSCDAILLTALDEIAWLLNVRGQDVAYNPVVMSYLLVTQDAALWFAGKEEIPLGDTETEDSFEEVEADGVTIMDYSEIGVVLGSIADDYSVNSLCLDPSSANYYLYNVLKDNALEGITHFVKSPIPLKKAIKTEIEIAGMKECHIEDGVAMEKFLFWIDSMLAAGELINEYDASQKLHEIRSMIDGFRGESFETISAYGANAALPHYITPETGSADLHPRGLYLCDSGGQYFFGTTDITRTVPLGPCSLLEKEDYTLVLKGHIDFAKAVFPYGTSGCQIDALARSPLWNSKRNFGHGTGHGVGFFLNVHEGPQDIRQNNNPQPLMPGMITSDEPGIYREGQFGIRHENLILCQEAGTNDFGKWLKFETLTFCHIDTSAILTELLDLSEIEWLNAYNKKVYETLSPKLSSALSDWLRVKTQSI